MRSLKCLPVATLFRGWLLAASLASLALAQIPQDHPEWCGKPNATVPLPEGTTFRSSNSGESYFTLRLKDGTSKTIELGIEEDVPQVCPISGDRLLVFGHIAGGDGPDVSIISQIDGNTLDKLGGRDPVVSPDQHWIVRRGWYGRFYEIQTDEYFLYDLTKTPAANADPARLKPSGRPIYPVTNVPFDQIDYDREQVHEFESNSFYWSPDSKFVAFADGYDRTISLVVVDVAKANPVTYVHPLKKGEACGPDLNRVVFSTTEPPGLQAYFSDASRATPSCGPLRLRSSDLNLAPAEIHDRIGVGPPKAPRPVLPAPTSPPTLSWTGSATNCSDVSGIWTDPDTGGTWSLEQRGNNVTGSLKITKPGCGEVSWKVSGKAERGVVAMTGTDPNPPVDKCGVAPEKVINATLTPGCTTGAGSAEPKR